MECCVCFTETTQTITDCCEQYLCKTCYTKVNICPACRDTAKFKPVPTTEGPAIQPRPRPVIIRTPANISFIQYSRQSTGELRVIAYDHANNPISSRQEPGSSAQPVNNNTLLYTLRADNHTLDCSCGSVIQKKSWAGHQRTQKHLNWVQQAQH